MIDQSELDRLMSLDPLELSTVDIEALISFYRNDRLRAADGSPRKAKKEVAGPKIDLTDLGFAKPVASTITRRLG